MKQLLLCQGVKGSTSSILVYFSPRFVKLLLLRQDGKGATLRFYVEVFPIFIAPSSTPKSIAVNLQFSQILCANSKDPIYRWVVKIEEHSMNFDPTQWVSYQGDIYVGQEGACY